MDYKTTYPLTKAELTELYNQSALTLEGLKADKENLDAFAEWINQKCNGSNITFHIISGKTMNEVYKLRGTNAYSKDLTIVAVTGIDTFKVTTARFEIGARWFDDIVDNSKARKGA